jgi:hypothetical protein
MALKSMNALEESIQNALMQPEDNQFANKAYLEFIKANFIIPVEKSEPTEPRVLFLEEKGQYFLPVFSSMTYFDNWAKDIADDIQLLKLSGVDLLKGLGTNVIVCLNIGSDIYKEFQVAETDRMKGMVLKLFK